MNSRFKFRVWDKTHKTYECCQRFGAYFIDQCGDLLFIEEDKEDGCWIQDSENFIVEQCTGLKDKNGKLIYEGDVVVGSWSTKLIVFWDVISSSFRVKAYEDKCGDREIHYYTVIATPRDGSIKCINYEIIGNVHEMEIEQ